ncbi:hypothetical protein HMPREF0307_02400 [Corynebacterium sp. DNF00584]|nr:hypothetical protein HMPREF0307_02400 [Corynebacterium sp. DNF00584]
MFLNATEQPVAEAVESALLGLLWSSHETSSEMAPQGILIVSPASCLYC